MIRPRPVCKSCQGAESAVTEPGAPRVHEACRASLHKLLVMDERSTHLKPGRIRRRVETLVWCSVGVLRGQGEVPGLLQGVLAQASGEGLALPDGHPEATDHISKAISPRKWLQR